MPKLKKKYLLTVESYIYCNSIIYMNVPLSSYGVLYICTYDMCMYV